MSKKRLQELAGINIPFIILYSSFLPEDFDSKNIPFNGTSGNEEVILCSKTRAVYVGGEDFDELVKYIEVTFRKSVDEIFLDYDDHELGEFGIEVEDQKKAYLEIKPYMEANKPYPLSNLIKFGLKDSSEEEYLMWYGCYVKEIKQEEIIKITKINF